MAWLFRQETRYTIKANLVVVITDGSAAFSLDIISRLNTIIDQLYPVFETNLWSYTQSLGSPVGAYVIEQGIINVKFF